MHFLSSGYRFTLLLIFIVIFAALYAAQSVQAHGQGATVEIQKDGFLIDIGHAPEKLVVGSQTRFDFLLYTSDTNEPIEFSDVWARIEKEGQLKLAGGIADPFYGTAGLSFNFSEAGDYTLYVRYQNGRDSLVEATIDLTVSAVAETLAEKYSWLILPIVAGIFIGILMTIIWCRFTGGKSIVGNIGRPKIDDRSHRRSLFSGLINSALKFLGKFKILSFKHKKLIDGFFNVFIGVLMVFLLFGLGNKLFNVSGMSELFPINFIGEKTIKLTDSGFVPQTVTINVGDSVTFVTDVDRPFWPASNLHPSHEIYSAFDPKMPLTPEESWSFTFDRAGDWKFHDHIRSYFTGMIHVKDE